MDGYAGKGHQVLLIDDDSEFCELMTDYLDVHSFAVSSVHTGTAGIEAARRQEYDVILLDMFLPDINGLDVLRRIRRMQSPPVVMLSAHNEETDRIIALEIGADDYVPKAFSSRELLARIRAVLRRCAPEQESAPPEKTDGRDILRAGTARPHPGCPAAHGKRRASGRLGQAGRYALYARAVHEPPDPESHAEQRAAGPDQHGIPAPVPSGAGGGPDLLPRGSAQPVRRKGMEQVRPLRGRAHLVPAQEARGQFPVPHLPENGPRARVHVYQAERRSISGRCEASAIPSSGSRGEPC